MPLKLNYNPDELSGSLFVVAANTFNILSDSWLRGFEFYATTPGKIGFYVSISF